MLKLISVLVIILTIGVGQMWGADESVTFSAQNYTNQQEISSYSGTNFSIAFNKGTNNSNPPKYFTSGTAIRAYGGNYFTVSSSTKTITKIELTFGSSDGSNTITTDVNTYSNGTWTGSASSVKFTIGGTSGNRRLAGVAVTYASSKTLSSIAITTPPTTKYLNGDTFSKTGAVVRATYSDASTADVSSTATWNKTTLTTSDTQVTASYTEGGTTKTADQSINVYSVTVQKQDETGATITADGVSASASGRTLTASATAASKYVFKGWKYGTASGTSIASSGSASTTLNGTPTGNVTIIAEFYAPLTATWMVAGSEWTGKNEQTTFARGSHVSALPTAPNPNNSEGCGDKFVGWTTVEEYAHGSSPLYTSASQIPNATTNQIFYAVFADYDE